MTTGGILHFLFSLFSWIWILPAYLAGIFLTNSWVYGSVLGMDSFLWLIRNLMKNISNFLLAFFFIYLIIQALFSEKSATSIVKDGLLKILVSGIAIQSSWFLTSVLLDISTISTAAVGSLASQLISANPQLQNTITLPKDTLQALYKQMDQSASIASGYLAPLHLNLFPEAVGSTKSLFKVSAIKPAGAGSGMNQEEVVDLFMPNAQTLA